MTSITFLRFFIPISIWLFLFRGLLSGTVYLSTEPFGGYTLIKHYLNYLQSGVFPLWNPYFLWGYPWQVILNYFGFANPIWLGVLALKILGLPIYFAFIYVVVFYFLLGQLGVYFLAKTILRDQRAAYAAFLMSLFSSSGLLSLTQFNMLFIFVPAVWFFYFLIRFFQDWSRGAWLGIVFTLMLISQAYLPFYFLTVLLLAGLISCLIFSNTVRNVFVGLIRFMQERWSLVCLSAVFLILAIIPVGLVYQDIKDKEIVIPWRQSSGKDLVKGIAFSKYDEVVRGGGITARTSFDDLFANPDQMLYGNDGIFYVPGFVFLLLLMGAFMKVSRRGLVLALVFFSLWIISVGTITPVHEFLFEHVFYFRWLRNLQFFIPFLITILVLLAAEQLRLLLCQSEQFTARQRIASGFVVAIVHGSAGLFLRTLENVSPFVYGTILCSFVLSCVVVFSAGSQRRMIHILLFLCIVAQPVAFLEGYNRMGRERSSPIIKEAMGIPFVQPSFSYVRPFGEALHDSETVQREDFYASYLKMNDGSLANMSWSHGTPTFGSYSLSRSLTEDVLNKYVRYKFVVYDGTLPGELAPLPLEDNRHVQFILEGSPLLRVTSFNANQIRLSTNFPEPKFLVYNDSYTKDWIAKINGHPVKVERVHTAFKGVSLPAGPQVIEFLYQPWGGVLLPLSLIFLHVVLLIFLIYELALVERNKPRV